MSILTISQFILRRFVKLVEYIAFMPLFGEWHISSYIRKPIKITPRCIFVGKNVNVNANCRIEGVYKYNKVFFSPKIELHDGCSIEQNLHLTCAQNVIIGKNTSIAANVTITDINHPYENVLIPIEQQDIKVASVMIKSDCKVYNNSIILPGVTIGCHCVIGANSVVTKDIPDYCVAVGAPARVVKKYDFEKKEWIRV